jgi:ribonuclease HI
MSESPKKILEEFKTLMQDLNQRLPESFNAFINEKEAIIKDGCLPKKTKWLLVLVSALLEKCPVCISRAVEHCLENNWSREEMLEACMVAVLIGGSSVMTYLTFVDKAIAELQQ